VADYVARWFIYQQTFALPDTSCAWHRATTLNGHNVLSIRWCRPDGI